tara:strand:+ start:434 stop:625 length:192 start_codon:yes stop_codon:yes gene_type:complete
MKFYEFTVTVKTIQKPSDAIWYITTKLKDVLPVISINYKEVEDRPTTVEHHGGVNEDTKLATS